MLNRREFIALVGAVAAALKTELNSVFADRGPVGPNFSKCKTWGDASDVSKVDLHRAADAIAERFGLTYQSHLGSDPAFKACLTNSQLHQLLLRQGDMPFITFNNGWAITTGDDVIETKYAEIDVKELHRDSYGVEREYVTSNFAAWGSGPYVFHASVCLRRHGERDSNIYRWL